MARFSHSTCSKISTASKLGKLSVCVATQTKCTCTKSYRSRGTTSTSKLEWRSKTFKSLKSIRREKRVRENKYKTRSKTVATNTYALIIVLHSLSTNKRDGQNGCEEQHSLPCRLQESTSCVGLGEKQRDEDLLGKHQRLGINRTLNHSIMTRRPVR